MNPRALSCIAACLAGFTSLSASALDNAAYIGVSGGQAWIDVTEKEIEQGFQQDDGFVATDTMLDRSDLAWKAYFGVRAHRFLGLEAGYVDLGKATFTTTIVSAPPPADAFTPFTIRGSAKATGYNFVLVAGLPLGPVFLFAKGGGFYWTAEFEERIPGVDAPRVKTSVSDTTATYGSGLELHLSDNVAIRAEWERFEGVGIGIGGREGLDVDMASAGLLFSF